MGWVIWLKVSLKASGNLSAGAAVLSEGSTGEGSSSKLTRVIVGRIQSRGLLFSLFSSLLHGPFHSAAYNAAAGFQLQRNKQENKRVSKTEVRVFFNLTTKVTPHHCGHILSLRSKSLRSSQQPRGGDYTKVWIPGGRHSKDVKIGNAHGQGKVKKIEK